MQLLKLDQSKRNAIIDSLVPKAAQVGDNIKLGDSVLFTYMHRKIKISGRGIVIRIQNKIGVKYIQLLCEKDNMVVKLYFADKTLTINKVGEGRYRVHRSHLNHLILKRCKAA